MSASLLPRFAIAENDGHCLTLRSPEGHVARLFVLEEDILRFLVLPGGTLRQPRSWAVAPGAEDVPADGRDRFDLSGFSCPCFEISEAGEEVTVATPRLRVTIALEGLFCRWESRIGGTWREVAADRPTQAYNFGTWGNHVFHYLRHDADEMYFGLGERAGEADRAGKSYRMCNLDAMGYSARTTDPLYKHIPFYLVWKKNTKSTAGFFYDTLADCTFDMGRELDNYHGHYRTFEAEAGDLDLYVLAGETPAEIARRFTWLTGRPAMMPKWSLGYSGSTMSYTDAPDAAKRMGEFLDKCAEHDILCSSFHLSSGYTSIGENRYVFNWNRDKFPDPAAFAHSYLDHGVRLIANIKPCLLHDHPRYAEAAQAGLFVCGSDGTPEKVQFWGSWGSYLDFTNPATLAWWKARVTDALLEVGIAATWNDNNEFEIWNPEARICGFGHGGHARESRTLHTLQMIRASRAAQLDFAPQTRPFLVSRAGAVGMQRYVQTWSGDNYTSWETLKYNVRMGTGLAMCGISNLGHDIGGFAGPTPGPELLVRWVGFGIFLPRFSIHSWNDDATVNEPWMYPEVTPAIAKLIRFRARLVPHLYDLMWRSHAGFEPMVRPTYYEFPDDARCFAENDEMMLGANLLVAPVVEPGVAERRVYLPAGVDWYDYWSGARFAGGTEAVLAAPWDRPPVLARAGSAVALNLAEQHFNKPADTRGFDLFPPTGAGNFLATCYEDDGESEAFRGGHYGSWMLNVAATEREITVTLGWQGAWKRPTNTLVLRLPAQEWRRLVVHGGHVLGTSVQGSRRIVSVALD